LGEALGALVAWSWLGDLFATRGFDPWQREIARTDPLLADVGLVSVLDADQALTSLSEPKSFGAINPGLVSLQSANMRVSSDDLTGVSPGHQVFWRGGPAEWSLAEAVHPSALVPRGTDLSRAAAVEEIAAPRDTTLTLPPNLMSESRVFASSGSPDLADLRTVGHIHQQPITPVPKKDFSGGRTQPVQADVLNTPAPVSVISAAAANLTVQQFAVSATHQSCGRGPGAPAFSEFATFRGGVAVDEGRSIAVAGDGTSYTAGITTDPSTGQINTFVTAINAANPTMCTTATFSDPGGLTLDATHVAVDPAGVYVSLNSRDPTGSTATTGMVLQVSLDLSTLVQSTRVGDGSLPVAINSIALGGGFVALTGSVNNGAQDNLLAGSLNETDFTINPTLVSLNFGGPSVGRAVAKDGAGNLYLGGSLDDFINQRALFLSMDANLQSVRYAFVFTSTGRGGTVTGTAVNGNFLDLTGILPAMPSTGVNFDMLLARVDLQTGVIGPGGYAFDYFVPGGDLAGNDIASAADGVFVAATMTDGSGTHGYSYGFGPFGDTIETDQLLGGSGRDSALGVAINLAVPGNLVFIAGWTESPDFTPIRNACQPVLAGIRNAFIAGLRLFLPQVTIVNTIPPDPPGEPGVDFSAETNHQTEPSIAVRRTGAAAGNDIVIGTFGTIRTNNPYFTSTNAGLAWSNVAAHDYIHGDTSIGWAPGGGGTAYAGFLRNNGTIINVASSNNPTGGTAFANLAAAAATIGPPPANDPDQPHVWLDPGCATDCIFVGFNDVQPANGRTASVHYSLDSGTTWTPSDPGGMNRPISIDNIAQRPCNPPRMRPGQDAPVVRVASARIGLQVYAAYINWNCDRAGDMDVMGDVVVVRDDNLGRNNFRNLGAGGNGQLVMGADTRLPNLTTGLGANQPKIRSSLSLAVHPTDQNKVYVAFAIVDNMGRPVVQVWRSNNGGAAWGANPVFTAPVNSALPSLAVADNGDVGLLYASLNGGSLEEHFVRSRDDFATAPSNLRLVRFPDANPNPGVALGPPGIFGDFQEITAVGNRFYGAFSATNDLNQARFARGLQNFARNHMGDPATGAFRLRNRAGTANVNFSIDSYFFSTTM
jgi:hypothetical protein